MVRLATVVSRVGAAIVLFAAVCAFYWKLSLSTQYEWMTGLDLSTQVLAWFQAAAEQWRAGQFPLWDTRLWNGQSMAGQAQPGVLYPPNWLLFASPSSDGRLQTGYLRFHCVMVHWIALGLCYWMCRGLGLSRAASFLGGAAFSFDGFIGTVGWPQWIAGASWAPPVFLFQLRAMRGERPRFHAMCSGAALGISVLGGHPQVPVFLSLASGGLWLVDSVRRRRAAPFVSAVVFAGLFAAPQVLPAIEFGRESIRWVSETKAIRWDEPVPYGVHETYSFDPRRLTGLVIPGPLSHVDIHMGAIVAALAFLALTCRLSRLPAAAMAGVALFGCLAAMGGWGLLHGVLYAIVPGVEKARNPATAMALLNFGLAVLAAYGLDALGEIRDSRWMGRVIRALLGLAAVLLLAPLFPSQPDLFAEGGITAVASIVGAGVLHGIRVGTVRLAAARAALILAALVEFGHSTRPLLAPRTDSARNVWMDRMKANQDLAAYMKQQPGRFRVETAAEEVPRNWGSWHGLDMWGGYLPAVSRGAVEMEFSRRETKMLWGVQFTIAREAAHPSQREVFRGAGGLNLFYDPDAFPRVWPVHQAIAASGRDHVNAIVRERWSDLRFAAIVKGPGRALPPCGGQSTAELKDHAGSALTIAANMACDGLVVISESWAPGWEAAVDGEPAPVMRVNGSMRAVPVPLGSHMVRLRYRPSSVLAGAAMALAGAALLAIVWRRG